MIYVQLHHFNGEIVIYEIYLNTNIKNKLRKKLVINQIHLFSEIRFKQSHNFYQKLVDNTESEVQICHLTLFKYSLL